MDSRVRGNDRGKAGMTEKKIQRNLHHGGNIEIFAPRVVQIWNDFNDDVVIFALGVVQYFYEGGSNLDP